MTLTQRLTEILDTIFDQGMCYDLADEPDKFHDECIKSNLSAILTAIREECLKYDKEWGDYPESQYEGLALYAHLMRIEEREIKDEYVKDLEKIK